MKKDREEAGFYHEGGNSIPGEQTVLLLETPRGNAKSNLCIESVSNSVAKLTNLRKKDILFKIWDTG